MRQAPPYKWGRSRQTKPIQFGRQASPVLERAKRCETNPIWPVGRRPEGEIGKTKSRLVLCFQEPGMFV
jgi:hypothetical protein